MRGGLVDISLWILDFGFGFWEGDVDGWGGGVNKEGRDCTAIVLNSYVDVGGYVGVGDAGWCWTVYGDESVG